MRNGYDANRWARANDWDDRALRLDKFAADDPENGFSAFNGAADPKPGLKISSGKVSLRWDRSWPGALPVTR